MKKILLYTLITLAIIIIISLVFNHFNSKEMAPGIDDSTHRLIANTGGE